MEKTDKYRFLITKINLPSCGRGNSGPFKCILRLPAQHPPTCHGTAARDLSPSPFPTSVRQAPYIDDTMLTCEDWPLLQDVLQALLDHL